MNSDPINNSSSTRIWIPVGSAIFVLALTVSALVVPQLRLLHVLQALIYVTIVILARRHKHPEPFTSDRLSRDRSSGFP